MCPRAPVFTCSRRSGVTGGGGMGGGDNLGCCLQPALSAASCSAQLRSVKPRIYTASAMRARRRERRREGDTERRGAPHTPARTNCGLSVSLSSRQRHTPFSLTVRRHNLNAEVKIPTRALSPSLSLDPIFVRLSPPPPSLFFFFSFLSFFLSPCRSETVWLVNPARPETDSSLYYSTGERDRFADR